MPSFRPGVSCWRVLRTSCGGRRSDPDVVRAAAAQLARVAGGA
ncbi:hypothetical protein ABT297_37775 [Dactylosporangium sp. NPDC000555]